MKLTLTIIALLLSGCATHQWTAAELAAFNTEQNDKCKTSDMGPSATVWCKSSGQPMPAVTFMPGRMEMREDEQ